MELYSIIEILTLIFVTMGPIKVLVTYAEKTDGLGIELKRRWIDFAACLPDDYLLFGVYCGEPIK